MRSANDPDDGPPEHHLRIFNVVRRIPAGRVATYGAVARIAGLPRRHRLVGFLLRTSPLADDLPWHRVVNASGRISDRPGPGPSRQRMRLEQEGVTVDELGRIDLRGFGWGDALECREVRSSAPAEAPPT